MTFTDVRKMWRLGWWARFDALGHAVGLPGWVMRPVCNRFERSLGAPVWVLPTVTTGSSSANVTWTWSRKRHDA